MAEPRPLSELPDPLTLDEVASALRIGRSTAFDLIKRGEIRHLRAGRSARPRILVYKADLTAWIEANMKGGTK